MALNEVKVNNDMLLIMAQHILDILDAEELDSISIKGEFLEGGKVKNTITFTGDYIGELTEDSEIKTGDKININMQSGE